MKIPGKRFLLKTLKITGISVASLLLLLYLLPILFPGTIGEKVKGWANDNLDGEVNFSKLRLSFFDYFPSFTVSLHDFSLKGSAPFKNDTLVAADKISFGINLKNLIFDNKVHIDKIFLSDAEMHVMVNENGEANYNVYKSGDTTTSNSDTATTAMKLEKIRIKNSHLIYDDKSTGLLINAKGFNYKGNGDLSKAIFDLNSHLEIDSMDLYYEKEPYLKNKKLKADLVTKINTNSLAFIFERNDLKINKLPVKFTGKFDFLKKGYSLDFTATSTNSDLDDFVTALPPQYVTWQKNADIKGSTDLLLTLKGEYIASTNTFPELAYNMKIRDGYIEYEGAPYPASNLYMNLETKLPELDVEKLSIKLDSLYFNIDKDYFAATINTTGLTAPKINGRIHASMDLEKLDKAFGFQNVDLKGKCDLHFKAEGTYATGPNQNSIRHENILQSIPAFKLDGSISNGYLKYTSLPQAISKINFEVKSACPDNDYRNTSFFVNKLSVMALNNFINGWISVSSLKEMLVDANLQTKINLAEIKNVYPIKDIDLSGLLEMTISSNGKYNAVEKKFPLTTVYIGLNNGGIKTTYYPNPINNIQLTAMATNTDGTLKDLELIIQPASFLFEGKPFELQASFKNFEDIVYDVKANGELDIAKIYKVFSQKGMDVSGYAKANLHLQGKQSDAVNKNYNRLSNEGTLELKDVSTTTEYLPKPFIIKEGLFKFQQDKTWFNNFKALYGQSDMLMNGYLQNVINYALSPRGILKGNFNLQSNNFNVDEWMVYATNDSTIKKDTVTGTGVVMVPPNLDLVVTAKAKHVSFNSLNLDNAKGNLILNNGSLSLKQTGFNIIGSETIMDATYKAESVNKASFDFKIKAKDFDIKKAYDSVKLFRDMATSAGSSQGIVSLDYVVKGKLDGNMQPIYPSLEGSGVLSVQKVKVKGFKLLNTVSRKTGKDSIADPDVSKVDIKSKIKNNLLTIERFKIKMFGFRLRTEGQTSLDGKLNLKMRLGLPPLGIIGIPMRVTGTQDDPKVKLGKGDKEELSETEYKEEENIP